MNVLNQSFSDKVSKLTGGRQMIRSPILKKKKKIRKLLESQIKVSKPSAPREE